MTGLAFIEKLPIEQETYEKEFQEIITRPGPINFVSILANDSYKGLDQKVECEVNVIEKDDSVKPVEYCQDDLDEIKVKKDDEPDTADSDAEAPEIELDKDELHRKLSKAGLAHAASAFTQQLKTQEYN